MPIRLAFASGGRAALKKRCARRCDAANVPLCHCAARGDLPTAPRFAGCGAGPPPSPARRRPGWMRARRLVAVEATAVEAVSPRTPKAGCRSRQPRAAVRMPLSFSISMAAVRGSTLRWSSRRRAAPLHLHIARAHPLLPVRIGPCSGHASQTVVSPTGSRAAPPVAPRSDRPPVRTGHDAVYPQRAEVR